jgi:hypothetical protein
LPSSPASVVVTFESPAGISRLTGVNAWNLACLEVPDALEVLALASGGCRGFVCSFGRDSQLRELSLQQSWRTEFGFLRMSEPALKRLRALQ